MADAVTTGGREEAIRRYLLPLGAVVGIVVIAVAIKVLADPRAGQNLLAFIYEQLGNQDGALALRQNRGDVGLSKILLAVVALVIGVGGIWMIYTGAAAIVGLLRPALQERILPWVFIIPAILLLIVYLVYPTVATIIRSFLDDDGAVTLAHYSTMTTAPFLAIFRNNIIWLIVATGGSVFIGLVIAGLLDRVRREALAKTFIFLPLAISLVGASVIWRFVYAWRPEGQAQYGLFNAGWTALGQEPVDLLQTQGVNTFALIVIMIWLQTGFAMVVLSAAIKGVSTEIIEAARLDGANESQLFFRVIVPIIKGSIVTVSTTIAITVLKVFDIVYVMPVGSDADVVATRMFAEMFTFFNDGRAAALACVLFLAVLPIMFVNVRNLRRQGIGA
jgi:alpha-glucoside transport system permease protein